jgi:hypothetical protein
MVTRQQALLDRATVCLRVLRDNTRDPNARRMLEGLRELWKELALEIWLLQEAELAEQLNALSDVQATVLAEIRRTKHAVDLPGPIVPRYARTARGCARPKPSLH